MGDVARGDGVRARMRRLWPAMLLLVVLAGAFVVRVFVGASQLALYQLCVFPLVVLAFSQVALFGIKPPKILLMGALFAGAAGALFTHSNVDLAAGAFVVAQFEEDELSRETKIFRDRIRKVLGWRGLTVVGTHSASVDSFEEAAHLLRTSPKLSGVIWGTPRWLTVSLKQYPMLPVFAGEAREFVEEYQVPRRVQKLQVITSVPGVGLSSSGESPTVEFLGRLADVWQDFAPALNMPHRYEGYEMALRTLSGTKGKWTSFSHRALPMWMTGTLHLARAVHTRHPELGEILCAIKSFEAATSQLRQNDNPELMVAILNNQAIAQIVRSYLSAHRVTEQVKAKELLKQATQVSFAKNPYPLDHGGVAAAQGNLKIVSAGVRPPKRVKNRRVS
jgi:hypothetical protein